MSSSRTNTTPGPTGNRWPTTFYGITEAQPGKQWRSLYEATWGAYRAWYLKDGDRPRPSLTTGRRMLAKHMPELVDTWEQLVDLADEDPTTARMLTLWNPPAFLPGCSQAVLVGEAPALIRNYDYHPDLCERVVVSSRWTGRRVLGMSDCLWGLVDGMNDAGLAVSLAYGGRPGVGEGFGIPLVVRYLLEVAETVGDVGRLLARLPVNMAYNLTIADRNADAGTFFVAPGTRPEFFPTPVAANHRGRTPEAPEHAQAFRSVERQDALLSALEARPDTESLTTRFLSPPLHNTKYEEGFGTVYTAVYRPADCVVEYVWPDSRWERTFDSPSSSHAVLLGPGLASDSSRTLTRALLRDDTGAVKSNEQGADVDEMAGRARDAINALAESTDPAAFTHLLDLSQHVGESLGLSARKLAAAQSWAEVADYSGTSRQAAWARWSTS